MRIIICGQAPSRIGDGRPFSGPSGKRLAALFGLRDYEELASQFTLTNLFENTAEKLKTGRGDKFDPYAARRAASLKMREWAEDPELIAVLGCGHNVFQALTAESRPFFHGIAFKAGPTQGVDVWNFPHPSGASAFWNQLENVGRATEFLKKLLAHYGMSITK
jgi:uracil-DNA glycosylase